MRRTIPALFAATLFASILFATPIPAGAASQAPPPSSEHSRAGPDREGWPDSRAGELARGWVHAFSTGEPEMKAFLASEMAPASLHDRKVPQRIEKYRTLREKYGKLSLVSVVKETPGELTVKLIDSDSATHDFVFTVQPASPFKLVSVGILEMGHGFGGFHH
jgi:hypothetical protein